MDILCVGIDQENLNNLLNNNIGTAIVVSPHFFKSLNIDPTMIQIGAASVFSNCKLKIEQQ